MSLEKTYNLYGYCSSHRLAHAVYNKAVHLLNRLEVMCCEITLLIVGGIHQSCERSSMEEIELQHLSQFLSPRINAMLVVTHLSAAMEIYSF